MSALTSLLVRDGVVPVRKIEEALQRQVISGGDVETVLLELDAVPENVLAGYRAAVYDLPGASREEVMGVPDDVLAIVPAEVAIEHRLVPLRLQDRALHVAVHEPLSDEQQEHLGFLLGFDLVPHIACEVRIAAGLALHYGFELSPRLLRLIDKVRRAESGKLPDVGSVGRGTLAGHLAEIPYKEPSLAPPPGRRSKSFGSMLLELAPPETEPPPPIVPGTEGHPVGQIPVQPPVQPPVDEPMSVASLRRIRGPMTLAAGERRIRQATNRDQILEVFFAFAQQFFDYTALFVVHDDVADGRAAYGPGAKTPELQTLTIPLDRPSAFSEARRTLAPQVKRLDQTEIDRDIALGIRRTHTPPALLMPIAIRQRVVLILYGDRDGEDFDIGAAMELVRFGPRVVEAFEQLIIRKKRTGYHESVPPKSAPTPELKKERASLKEVARAVAETAGSNRASGTRRDSGAWRPGRRTTSPGFAPGGSIEQDSWGSVARAPEPIRARPAAPAEPSAPARRQAETEPEMRAPDAPPSAVLGIPRAAPPPPTSELDLGTGFEGDDEEEPDISFDAGSEDSEVVFEEGDDEDYGDEDGQGDDEDFGEEGSDDRADEEDDDEDDTEDEEEHTEEDEDTDGEQPAEAGAHAARKEPDGRTHAGEYSLRDAAVDVVRTSQPPRKRRRPERPTPVEGMRSQRPRPEVVRVPDSIRSDAPRRAAWALDADSRSVIVDMGDQVHAQVDDLVHAKEPERQDELIRGLLLLGEAALPALAQAFPGPLSWDRHAGGKLPAPIDLSPVCRALVAFADRAAPYVAGLLSSSHPDVRFYAAVVASDMIHPELMDSVVERIHDEDEGVRRVALQLLPRFAGLRGFPEVRTVVRRTARIRGRDPSRRWQAIDALASLRDVEMIPKLIELLREDEPELLDHLHRALVTITGTDQGRSFRKWDAWWQKNRSRHRIEWLIDGLTHTDEAVRAHAGEELKRLTQEYYGYHAGSPKRDRELVAKRYRRWWEDEGQRRFA